jgi:two-component system, chemotaxis family, chemotaxis protein CheY
MYKFLIVDDSDLNNKILKDIILNNIDKESKIFIINNGLDAIEKYKKENPDIVFLDIIMPKMDGVLTLTEILNYDPDAKIVVISNLNDDKHVYNLKLLGIKEFISKPFSPESIINIIKKLIPDFK